MGKGNSRGGKKGTVTSPRQMGPCDYVRAYERREEEEQKSASGCKSCRDKGYKR